MEDSNQMSIQKILIIQTAFPGDVILATALLETIHHAFPFAKVDFLLRKGNEVLFDGHPFINEVLVLNKKQGKLTAVSNMAKKVRNNKYDLVINLHRFGSSGIIALYSGAKTIVGFKKNPFSFSYTRSFPHQINGLHETERNFSLLKGFNTVKYFKPQLYPQKKHFEKAAEIVDLNTDFICIAPSSVWFTKELPEASWVKLIQLFPEETKVVLIGAPGDMEKCVRLAKASGKLNCINAAGQLSLLESAALMKHAKMNYTNDSAPLHLVSAVNAPSRSFFLSTVPSFGFAGLSDDTKVIETTEKLTCRPCGLHGHKSCPQGHFKCAMSISINPGLLPNDVAGKN